MVLWWEDVPLGPPINFCMALLMINVPMRPRTENKGALWNEKPGYHALRCCSPPHIGNAGY